MTDKDEESYSFPAWLKVAFWIAAIFLIASSFFIIYKYTSSMTDGFIPDYPDRNEWGVFGDFLGGALNPLLGFASFIALLITIFYQSKELKASTKELKNSAIALAKQNKAIELQSFEQTFFSWLQSYQELIKSVEDEVFYHEENPNARSSFEKMIGKQVRSSKTGRSLLDYWWSSYFDYKYIWDTLSEDKDSEIPKDSIKKAAELVLVDDKYRGYLLNLAELHPRVVVDYILKTWDLLYEVRESKLDNLFRTLYSLIVWIDSQHKSRLTTAQKWLYISIIRSQLSWVELGYLFLNGLTKRGKNFKVLIEKYALLNNLTIESDPTINIINKHLYLDKNYIETAFNSELARVKLGLPRLSSETLAIASTYEIESPSQPSS
jgi:hypothetical protein